MVNNPFRNDDFEKQLQKLRDEHRKIVDEIFSEQSKEKPSRNKISKLNERLLELKGKMRPLEVNEIKGEFKALENVGSRAQPSILIPIEKVDLRQKEVQDKEKELERRWMATRTEEEIEEGKILLGEGYGKEGTKTLKVTGKDKPKFIAGGGEKEGLQQKLWEEEQKRYEDYREKSRLQGESPEYKPLDKMTDEETKRYIKKLTIEKLELEKQVAQEKLAEKKKEGDKGEAAGGGGEGGKQTLVHGPKQEALAGLQAEPLRAQKELKEGLKHETKPLGYALVSAAPIVIVSYFVLNNWIALAVNWLPAPIGPLLSSLWFVSYLAIYLLSFAMLSSIKSPATIVMSGILTAVIIGLVFGVLLNIFVDFLGPFLGPGLTCTLAQMKAQQQGGPMPPECNGATSTTPTADKTGGINLISASIGQSGVPFPTPRPGYLYQFPISISNPSDFDIGPIVVEGGYMCGKSGGYPICGSYDNINNFVPDYRMTSNGCNKDSDNCVVSAGGPPLTISLVGDKSNKGGEIVPTSFSSSYVSLYVNVRYPFKTSGTNDYYITKTYRDVPKTIQACEGSGTRQLGKACTGSGPLNVIPYFSESYLSMDQFNGIHNVALTVAISNVGDGTAVIKSIDIARLSTAFDALVSSGDNCHLPGVADFRENNLHAKHDFLTGEPSPLTVKGQKAGLQFEIPSGETANFVCDYTLNKDSVNKLLTGPYTSVKYEASVSYYYYETPSKTDILVDRKSV